VSAVAWTPDGQLLSCSDDKNVCRWGADGENLGKFPVGVFATSISWFPSTGKQAPDNFAMSCSDGTFRFVTRSGREEKKAPAHTGAVILIRWSHDGSAILTAGEDGDVKTWSKTGNLRSSLVSTGQSVYCACWGPDNDQVLIGNGKVLMIKTVQANRKNVQWNAHDGIVLCLDWNVANGNIVSGGEDCCYKVWDAFGRQLYSSRPMEHVITSIGWSPNGEAFAVGSYNIIRLCDKAGWTHCRQRLQSGSIQNLAWTSDGTQFACAGGNGSVVFAQVVDRRFEWKNTEVTLIESRKIRVQDVANEAVEDLEFSRDRVVEIALGFDFLIVATTTQCFVYGLQSLNTPIIFEIRAPPHFIHICRRHFLTLDQISGIQVVSFEGRVLSTPKFQGLRPEYLTRDLVSLSADTLVVVDSVDAKSIQIMDASSGRPIGKLTHAAEVVTVHLNQHSLGPQERVLAFADKNRDLFVASLHAGAGPAQGGALSIPTYKLHSHVESFSFNDDTNVLVGLADGCLKYWYQPEVALVDKDLLALTTSSVEASEYGRSAQIVAYTGNRVSIRKVDGSILFTATSPDVPLLYELTRAGRWEEATRLCRVQRSNTLWATLASMAVAKKQLDSAEIALSELNEVAKVSLFWRLVVRCWNE
jgi:intraflagellar transport protein 80